MSARRTSEVDPDTPFGEAMKSVIHDRWADVWKAIPVAVEGSDPEGVHDVRVASRRLRAAMDVSVDAFPAGWFRPLHKVAKQITSELGEVRDRDVLIGYFEEYRSKCDPGERPGVDLLLDRLNRERDEARVEMLAFLESLEHSNVRRDIERRFGPFYDGEAASE